MKFANFESFFRHEQARYASHGVRLDRVTARLHWADLQEDIRLEAAVREASAAVKALEDSAPKLLKDEAQFIGTGAAEMLREGRWNEAQATAYVKNSAEAFAIVFFSASAASADEFYKLALAVMRKAAL